SGFRTPLHAFFWHDCCATVGTDIVARQSKADAQTSFDIIVSLEVAICGPEYRCGSISGNNKIRIPRFAKQPFNPHIEYAARQSDLKSAHRGRGRLRGKGGA